MPAVITKTFKYKIRATREFAAAAERALEASRFVYNCALEQRLLRYRQGKPIGFLEQSRQLTEARTLPDIAMCRRRIQADALERLDHAFQAFFRRLERGEKAPGFPRFKSKARYRTFSIKTNPNWRCPLDEDRLTVSGVGTVRVFLSRPIEGHVKKVNITRRADGWYAMLVCDMPQPTPLVRTGQSSGIDLGVVSFATLSNGEVIPNPRHLRGAGKALKRSQQALDRKKKKSANRAKARRRYALRHLKVHRARWDFHHKTALDLVRRFDMIRIEDLEVRNLMERSPLANAIGDSGWGSFTKILTYKAAWANRELVKVDPTFTSQTCSVCGHRQKMPLEMRVFTCGSCGLSMNRDHNAAVNIGRGAPKLKPALAAEVSRASRNRRKLDIKR